MKVSWFCLQPKEFSNNISLESGTPAKRSLFPVPCSGKAVTSLLVTCEFSLCLSEKSAQQFSASFIQGGETLNTLLQFCYLGLSRKTGAWYLDVGQRR